MDRKEISDFIVEYDCDKGNTLDSLASALQDRYSGVTNGFLSEVHEMLYSYDKFVEFEGDVKDSHKCPCCGCKSLDEIHCLEEGTGYDICQVCRWEDDGTADVERRVSLNRGSISEYRDRMKANQIFVYRERFKK